MVPWPMIKNLAGHRARLTGLGANPGSQKAVHDVAPYSESNTAAASPISSPSWCRYTARVMLELMWPTWSAITSTSTPAADIWLTNVPEVANPGWRLFTEHDWQEAIR